jgi:hypothetical protein
MKPHDQSDPDHYCRLFPPSNNNYAALREGLTQLGCAMTDERSSQSWNRPILPISVGYTYFGQFIDHDLTKDESALDDLTTPPHKRPNKQSPKLDLSHLYGGGPESRDSAGLYEYGARLKLGEPGKSGVAFDIYTDPVTKKRVLADDRSGENWILRQITAVFARLHNFAVDHCDPSIAGLPEFERARLQTTWQFQWLVRNDYLRTVLDPGVYTTVFSTDNYKPRFEWDTFSIPVEFTVAAFRFGHSMVRSSYRFSSVEVAQEVELAKIFGRVEDRTGKIPDDFEINWGFFFQGAAPNTGNPVTARPIDTQITDPLHHIPPELARLFNIGTRFAADDPPQLPVRTLRRGAAMKLPAGQDVADFFGVPALTEDELIRNSKGEITNAGITLKKYGMVKETPLWYYILKESEVWSNGNSVGPTGSYIIAETIHAALRYDDDSYLKHEAMGGRPPLWRFPDKARPICVLSELFREAAAF